MEGKYQMSRPASLTLEPNIQVEKKTKPAMTRRESRRSLQSIYSSRGEKKAQLALLFSKRFNCLQRVKLIAVSTLPLLVLTSVCTQSIWKVTNDIRSTKAVQTAFRRSQRANMAMSALISERSSMCEYLILGSNHSGLGVNETITFSTELFALLSPTQPNVTMDTVELYDLLARHKNLTCFDLQKSYGSHIFRDSAELIRPFGADAAGDFWATIFAYNALLTAKDLIGLQRALGSSFFVGGGFPGPAYINFTKITGGADALLQNVVWTLSPESFVAYENATLSKPDTMNYTNEEMNVIFANDRSSLSPDAVRGTAWFDAMTDYIRVVSLVESGLTSSILEELETDLQRRRLEFDLSLGLVICALLLSPTFTVIYALRWRRMLGVVSRYAERLRQQQTELNLERRKADLLLCQILPKQVVEDIKLNKPVYPESFEDATVYFSDVDGFKELVIQSTPFQTVDFLNQLYRRCDGILDQFDAYKVETIGDCCMVVSGLPKRNGRDHSAIMATTALTMLMSIARMTVSFNASLKVRLRIGLHTGPLVAGIMGVRNQRYCLFGDTVNTASRMMSSGLPMRIHLSPQAHEHLKTYHAGKFSTVLRGNVKIKGKGTMTTYWLLSKLAKKLPRLCQRPRRRPSANWL